MTGARVRVVVVGAGPAGLTAALSCAARGFAVTVLESGAALETAARADTLHPGTLEILEHLGVLSDALRAGQHADRFQFRELAGEVVAEFDLALLKDDTPHPYRLLCPQDWLVRTLFEHVRARQAEVAFGAHVTAVRQTSEAVQVEFERDGKKELVEAEYLVAADGAGSVVRASLGVTFEEQAKAVRVVQVMTNYDLTRALPKLLAETYVMDPRTPFVLTHLTGSWRALLPIPDGIPTENLANNAWHREAFKKLSATDAAIPIFHETLYAIRPGAAQTFRANRAFLIGDSAHVTLPFAGMGLNTGIHDAYSLANALHAHATRRAPVLDAWAAARRASAVNQTIAESYHIYEMMRTPASRRRKRNGFLQHTAADPEAARAYLLRTAMLADGEETPV
jgi:3-(3-hydroxy-phenyl)propionate hydroxylase